MISRHDRRQSRIRWNWSNANQDYMCFLVCLCRILGSIDLHSVTASILNGPNWGANRGKKITVYQSVQMQLIDGFVINSILKHRRNECELFRIDHRCNVEWRKERGESGKISNSIRIKYEELCRYTRPSVDSHYIIIFFPKPKRIKAKSDALHVIHIFVVEMRMRVQCSAFTLAFCVECVWGKKGTAVKRKKWIKWKYTATLLWSWTWTSTRPGIRNGISLLYFAFCSYYSALRQIFMD